MGKMFDPPTHNCPFDDKRDKVGMDGVPYSNFVDNKTGHCIISIPNFLNWLNMLSLCLPYYTSNLVRAEKQSYLSIVTK